MDAETDELRAAHDVLAEWYVQHLVGMLESMPVERAVLDLFGELTRAAGLGTEVADIGCGTGRLTPYLRSLGLTPRGVDLSPGMVRVARRDNPGTTFATGDLRDLPLPDAALAGAVCWYSLIFLAPASRTVAFAELARVVRPGGHLAIAYKIGEGKLRRGGRSAGLGVEYDSYRLPQAQMEGLLTGAGFTIVFWGGTPADTPDSPPLGYLIARRT
ncbi:class I SAM-dependent DNA methyltransferase [Micromonosporaceae bacterium Da 78-11]